MNKHLKFSDVMPNTVDINRYNYRNKSSFRSPIFLIVWYPEGKKFENHCSSWFTIVAFLKSQSQLFCETVPLFISKEVQGPTDAVRPVSGSASTSLGLKPKPALCSPHARGRACAQATGQGKTRETQSLPRTQGPWFEHQTTWYTFMCWCPRKITR